MERGVGWAKRLVAGLLMISAVLSFGYIGVSSYIAEQLVYEKPKPIHRTPATLGLTFASVRFPSREDHVVLPGWFTPGVLRDGRLTADRTLVVVHGHNTNRESPADHQLELTADLARHGLAVLSFDMRGTGESPAAPDSFGYFEQRDVLGAVDYLRSGRLPFPELGRPRAIGGLGISMGAATLLLAASREPAIQAVVSDSAYAAVAPLLEREIPKQTVPLVGRVPGGLAPSSLLMARLLYGIDFFGAPQVDAVRRIAPRPLFLIHGLADYYVPVSNFERLRAAATGPAAHLTTWLVPKVGHAQAYKKTGAEYVKRVVAFYDAALGADRSQSEAAA
jgi:uncharacterized protein